MNWEEKAEQLFEYIESILVSSKDFALEQTPILIQEFFLWFTVLHIYYIILGMVLIYIGYKLIIFGKDKDDDPRGKDWFYESEGLLLFPIITAWFIGITLILVHTYNLLQILVAPRIYLIEKLSTWFN